MIFMAIGVIVFFFNFLLPNVVSLITASGGKLPLITTIVIGISNFTTHYFLIIAGLLAGISVLLSVYFKTPGGRYKKDAMLLKIPVLGKTQRSVVTMRFARTTHTLVKSGLPLLQGLDLIRQTVNHALAEKAIDYAIEGLNKGEPMALNLAKANYFDGMALQMIAIGEETGEMEKVLEEMAEYFDQESETGFNRILALVEPMMLLVIGSVISVVIISVMLPMLTMVSSFNIQR